MPPKNPLPLTEGTIEQPPAPKPFMAMGTTGLRQSSGYVWEDFEKELRGNKAVRTYERMAMSDATCGAILWAIESVLRGIEWEVDPALPKGAEGPDAEPTEEAQEAAEFVRSVLFEECDTPWPIVVAEALSCLWAGFALAEVVFKRRDDGKIGIRDIEPRPQDTVQRWLFETNGKLSGVVQIHPVSGREIHLPMEKLLHWRVRTRKRSPEGLSIFRSAYKSWVYATNLENIEAIGLERDLAGLPVARVPQEIISSAQEGDPRATAQLAEFVRMVRDLRRNEQSGVVLPSDTWETPDGSGRSAALKYDLTLLASGSDRSNAADPAIRRHQARIAMAVLADFIMLGQGSTGSWALSSDKTELFLKSLEAVADAIAVEAQRGIVVPLWALNGMKPELRPKLRRGPITKPNIQALAEFITTLAGAGAATFPDPKLEAHLRKLAGLPAAGKDASEAAKAMLGLGDGGDAEQGADPEADPGMGDPMEPGAEEEPGALG